VFGRSKREKSGDRGDELVPIVTVGALEAELVAGQLREAGVEAVVFGTGTAGELVALSFAEGASVMVRRRDLDAAQSVLNELESL
jgi:hypothetical protein